MIARPPNSSYYNFKPFIRNCVPVIFPSLNRSHKVTRNKQIPTIIVLFFLASLFTWVAKRNPQYEFPVTGATQTIQHTKIQDAQNALAPKGNSVNQVSVIGKFSYPVVQSGNNPPSGNVIGQYNYASSKGNIGLLAHNFAAGSSFYALSNGDEVIITFSDGRTKTFVVNNVLRFQATDPNDYSKPFLDPNGKKWSPQQVFNRAFKSNGLTFQTCIENSGSATWGLLFVQAAPKN